MRKVNIALLESASKPCSETPSHHEAAACHFTHIISVKNGVSHKYTENIMYISPNFSYMCDINVWR